MARSPAIEVQLSPSENIQAAGVPIANQLNIPFGVFEFND